MTAQQHPVAPVQTRTHRESTAEASAQRFAADAAEAAKQGWVAASQAWDGPASTVVFQPAAVRSQSSNLESRSSEADLTSLTSGLPWSGIGIIAGGAMMAAGSFLPWLEATTGFASVSRGGLEGGDGIITLLIGAVIIVAGVGTRRRGRAWITALIASVIGLGIGWIDYQDVTERIATMADSIVAQVGVGSGSSSRAVAWR